MHIRSIGIDLGKATCHLVALAEHGKLVIKKKFTRKQLLTYTAKAERMASYVRVYLCPTKYGARKTGSTCGGFRTEAGLPISSNQKSFPRIACNEYSVARPFSTVAYHSIESNPVALSQ